MVVVATVIQTASHVIRGVTADDVYIDSAPPTDFLLLEGGDYILLENGDRIGLE